METRGRPRRIESEWAGGTVGLVVMVLAVAACRSSALQGSHGGTGQGNARDSAADQAPIGPPEPDGLDASCVTLENAAGNCPADWNAVQADQQAFCALYGQRRDLAEFHTFVSTAACRERLHYSRYFFDAGPLFCLYDPATLKLAAYARFDGKALFDEMTCGTTRDAFGDDGCAGFGCAPSVEPDAGPGDPGWGDPDGSVSSGPGPCTTVLASDYDQSCVLDSDCVDVGQVAQCPAHACDGCLTEAINKNALPQYMKAFSQAFATVPKSDFCGCPCDGVAVCRGGKCQAGFCGPPRSDTLAACANAGGTCNYSVNTTCHIGPADACAYSDEICCVEP